ncbi:MAG: LAGLIDADG family homing endonuclease [Candidatus Uhrbacteria bacterium]
MHVTTPDKSIVQSKRTPSCNVSLFDAWTPHGSYLLGFFAADGSMYRNPRGSYYIDFTSTDRELITSTRTILRARQQISVLPPGRRAQKTRYDIQIDCRALYEKLREMGFTERKSLTLRFPNIPDHELSHFVRGYFDGDGNITAGLYPRYNRPSENGQYISEHDSPLEAGYSSNSCT